MSSRAMSHASRPHVVTIGAGFCGLAAAYELGRQGIRITVLEGDDNVGGLAGSFPVGGTHLEKFYHHWFTSDVHVMRLIEELGRTDRILLRPTRTGVYYAHNFFKLSTPFDLLRFSPLSLPNRIRLGLLALRARRVKDWRSLEDRTAADVYDVWAGPEAVEPQRDLDTVVMSIPRTPNDALYLVAKDAFPEMVRIGDAAAPRDVTAAIFDGEECGRAL